MTISPYFWSFVTTQMKYTTLEHTFTNETSNTSQPTKEMLEKEPVVASVGLESFLQSGLIKGIGKTTAKLIVQNFGDSFFDIIESNPEALLSISRIGPHTLEQIKNSWDESYGLKALGLFLKQYDISSSLIARIYHQYRGRSVEVLQSNPWKLADDMYQVGFMSADSLARSLGFSFDHPLRVTSGVIYCLGEFTKMGHIYVEEDHLVHQSYIMLGVDDILIKQSIEQLVLENRLVKENTAIYLTSMYNAEIEVAARINRLLSRTKPASLLLRVNPQWAASSLHVSFDPIQEQAIETALQHGLMILTGGPGTGKTTTIRGIIKCMERVKKKVLLAAPTGRAAKRMTEATGREAKTIHRLLGCRSDMDWQHNERNPLKGDVLIVDECSMIDIKLMMTLLRAIPPNMRLIFVGDIDQLPSVGPGNVLRDMINSGRIPTISLTTIFRQAENSLIITNSHRVNSGQLPVTNKMPDRDYFFIEKDNDQEALDLIIDLVTKRLPNKYGINSNDIQILAPMKKGVLGVENLNKHLEKALVQSSTEIGIGSLIFREGDKVMQMRNNYDKDVFNGDIGVIQQIKKTKDNVVAVIQFDEKHVVYQREDISELSLAYATTVHKSQGSEYPIVIMPISKEHYVMLQRNILYTGLTRAKYKIILVGSQWALRRAVQNAALTKRNTLLAERIHHPN